MAEFFMPGKSGGEMSGFYRRLEEIRAMWDINRPAAEEELRKLMMDYPGLIEDMQTEQKTGQEMFMDAGMPEARLAGSPSNPFSYHVGASFLEHAGQGLQKYLGGKMMLGAKDRIGVLRDEERAQREAMGKTWMPKDDTASLAADFRSLQGTPDMWDMGGGGDLQVPLNPQTPDEEQKLIAAMLRRKRRFTMPGTR